MLAKLTVKTLDICNRFSRDEEGAGLVEYGMLVALIAAVVGVAVTTFGSNLSTGWSSLSGSVGSWFSS